VRGDVHTNTIEAFWANVTRGIKGTYVHVSEKYLQTYPSEFEFRHNLAKALNLMIEALLRTFVQPRQPLPATSDQSGA
jgi:transposase